MGSEFNPFFRRVCEHIISGFPFIKEKCLIKKMESSKSSISKRRSSKDNDEREGKPEELDVENLLEGDGSDDSQDEQSIEPPYIERLKEKIRVEREKIQR
ncbi:hypothetical protein NPIL_102461, partial [Nephila pilipes]